MVRKKYILKLMTLAENIAEPVFDKIVLDTTPPKAWVRINSDEIYTNTSLVNLYAEAVDFVSGVSEMSFSPDSLTWTSWEPFNQISLITLPVNDGKKTVYFKVSDKAGNIAKPVSDSIILDTTPPHSLSIIINDGASNTNSTVVKLKLNAIDDLSWVHQMSFRTDESSWSSWESFNHEKSFTLSPNNGKKTIYFRVKDKVGNIAEPVMVSILLNTTSPEPEIQAPDKAKPSFNFSRSFTLLLIIFIIIIILILAVLKIKRKKRSKRELPTGEVGTVKPIVAPTPDKLKEETTAKPTLAQPTQGPTPPMPKLASPKIVGQTPVPKQIPQPTLAPQLPPVKTQTQPKVEKTTTTPTLASPQPTLATPKQTEPSTEA